MMKLRALMTVLVVLTASGVCLVAARRFMPAQLNIDRSDTKTWTQVISADRDTAADRNHGMIVMERIGLKDRIVRNLVEGEITLEQAARRFLDLNKDNPLFLIGIECKYPNMDFKEAIHRNVLAWAEGVYGKLPRYPSIQRRLEAQFEDCRQNGFPLPAWPPQAASTVE
jgi:hypothetical protein